MALGAQPQNVVNTMTAVHNISDEIWYQAGDKAVDVSSIHFHLSCFNFLVLLVHETSTRFEDIRRDRNIHAIRQIDGQRGDMGVP